MRGAAVVLAATMAAAPAFADSFVLGTDGRLPRVSELRDGVLTGYEPAMAEAICELAELDCRWEIMPFDELDAALADGRIDGIMAGMASTFDRRGRYTMSAPYSPPGSSYYAGLTTRTFWGPGAKVAAIRGTLHAQRLQEENRILVPVEDAAGMMQALRSGRADAVFGPPYILNDLLRDEDLKRMSADLLISNGNAIAMRPGEDALKTRIDAAINALKRDGTVRALQLEWLR